MVFAQFVMFKLDEMDMAYASAPIPEGLLEHMEAEGKKHEVARLAREYGLEVVPPPAKRGRPSGEIDDLACAIRDVKRMREIFRAVWGKSNRYTRPTRTEIAAQYWELSKEEAEELVNRAGSAGGDGL